MPPIPDFLVRKKNKNLNQKPVFFEEKVPVKTFNNKNVQRALTRTLKTKLAHTVIQYVRKDFNTFGKLRKAIINLPDLGLVTDREIKSGIRYALVNRVPVTKIVGRGKTKQTTIRYFILSKKSSKTYEVVEV
jgi:hypothetical protein